MIVFHAADLLWASKIKGTADALGIPARPVRTPEMLAARIADSSPLRALIVDLDAPDIALALIRQLREMESSSSAPASSPPLPVGKELGSPSPRTTIIAFGPHVETDALRAAKAAGADSVMTRGSFHAKLPDLLQQLHNQHNQSHPRSSTANAPPTT